MNKISCTIFLFIFAGLFQFSGAESLENEYKVYKDLKNTEYQIIIPQNNAQNSSNKYGLIEKNSGKIIFKPKYNKIYNKMFDKHNIIVAEDQNSKYTMFSPDNYFFEIIQKYFLSNEKIKFYNYPIQNLSITHYMPFNETLKKMNIEYLSNNIIYISPSKDYFYNSVDSIINMILGVEYYCIKDQNFPGFSNEEISFENNIVKIKYKEIISGKKIELEKYKITKNKTIINNSIIDIEFIKNLTSINELYEFINFNSIFNFINYPQNGIIQYYENNEKKLKIIENGEVYSISGYSEYLFSDRKMFINRILFKYLKTNIKVSFQNPDYIIAKKGNKWGVIDRNNNIKIPFVYNNIIPIGGNVLEDFISKDNYNTEKISTKYIKKTDLKNIFFIHEAHNFFKIINDRNEIITQFYINSNIREEDYENFIKKSKYKNKINNTLFIFSYLNPIFWLGSCLININWK